MKCESCKNNSICKYVDDMKIAEEHADQAKVTAMSPIRVKAECRKYEDNSNSLTKQLSDQTIGRAQWNWTSWVQNK